MLSFAPAVLALRGGELAAYHGVEHKAIAAYESDEADAADAAKEHDRCGSHLVAPMLASNLAGALLMRRVRRAPGPAGRRRRRGRVDRGRRRGVRLVRAQRRTRARAALRRPGFEIQRLIGTREPDERQLEVGRAALARSCGSNLSHPFRVQTPVRNHRAGAILALMLLDGQRLQGDLRTTTGCTLRLERRRAGDLTATTAVANDGRGTRVEVEANIGFWAPLVFMGLICFVLWRTMKLMPRTKPQQIKPEAQVGDRLGRRRRAPTRPRPSSQEVVEFLRDPKRFAKLGAKVPKGILLHGPPGTGKTLLAKAVAKESGAQFFSQSAASFVEMFAGLGAARIRRLFAEARKASPAVIFIDELDAVGGERGSDNNSEREQTLNQLLVEMDGFGSTRRHRRDRRLEPAREARPGAAAPRPLRPPDLRLAARRRRPRGDPRGAHARQAARRRRPRAGRPPDRGPDRRRPGEPLQRGRDLRRPQLPRPASTRSDFDSALERVVAGMQSRRTLNEHERRVVAFHEAGHALCAELLPGVDRVHKISIVPRGRALGYTLNLPEEDRYLKTREELHRLHDRAARRARRRADRVRRGHHRRLRRPHARRRDLALDGPRVRDGHVDHVAQGVRRGRRGVRPHASAARRGAAAPGRRGDARSACGSSPSTATSSTRWRAPCCATRCSNARDIDRIMDGVPRFHRMPGHGLRVVAATATDV